MDNQTPVYCISGMGATCELYQFIDIGRPLHFIEWIEPFQEESLSEYCGRMAEQIKHDGPIVLIGVSFGGIATAEIAKQRPVEKAILISSLKSDAEKPAFFKLLSKIPLYKFQNYQLRVRSLPIWGKWFGLEDEVDRAFYLKNMALFSDNYLSWSIRQLANWESSESTVDLHHIHGDADRIFPLKYINNATVIKGGNHAMVVKKADQVSAHLKAILAGKERPNFGPSSDQ